MLESQNILDVHTAPNVHNAGMGRPKKHEGRKAITVYVSEAEYKWIQLQAGEIPIASWCRGTLIAFSKALAPGSVLEVTRRQSDAKDFADNLGKAVAETIVAARPKSAKTCAHGVERGYHCWQCQGLAKVE